MVDNTKVTLSAIADKARIFIATVSTVLSSKTN